jgi:predicted phosphoribosyltransferase
VTSWGGALASGGVTVLDEDLIRAARVSDDEIRRVATMEQADEFSSHESPTVEAIPRTFDGRCASALPERVSGGGWI